jgi:hypothetical protein
MSVITYEVTIEWHRWPNADKDTFTISCESHEDIALKCENEAYERRVRNDGIVPSIPIITSLKIKNSILKT